jgi:type III secretion system (T3SS) SseB-like protein
MRELERRTEQVVRFLGEQDGPPERQLKQTLRTFFSGTPGVRRAYLARVAYATSSEQHVALCLAAPEAADLASRIGAEFSRFFGASTHLDVLFLGAGQEAECRSVCESFYDAG